MRWTYGVLEEPITYFEKEVERYVLAQKRLLELFGRRSGRPGTVRLRVFWVFWVEFLFVFGVAE